MLGKCREREDSLQRPLCGGTDDPPLSSECHPRLSSRPELLSQVPGPSTET